MRPRIPNGKQAKVSVLANASAGLTLDAHDAYQDYVFLEDRGNPMPEHAYAEVNGVRLHYAFEGQGPLILFAHGFPEFWYSWRKQIAEFGKTHLAVAPDLRGYNLSSKPPHVEDYAMRHLVEDVRALAEHFGFGPERKFILVGHDWGGAIGWAFALAHPEALERLIIINAPHLKIFARELHTNPSQRRASAYMLLLRMRFAETILSAFRFSALRRDILLPGVKRGYYTEEDAQAFVEAWSQPGAMTGALNYYRALPMKHLRRGNLPREAIGSDISGVIKIPTLVIWGMKDKYLLPGCLKGLEEFVPHLTLQKIPEASHWIVQEMPELVNSCIRKFLSQNSS